MTTLNDLRNTAAGRDPRNAHLFESVKEPDGTDGALVKSKRIRQNSKPLLNKLEGEWLAKFGPEMLDKIHVQAVRLKLANGVTYTPDFFRFAPQPAAWEIKGPQAWDDAIVKLKTAATAYPEITFHLCWKEDGVWRSQTVLP